MLCNLSPGDASAPCSCGIPRVGVFDAPRFERAVNELLLAAGLAPQAPHMHRTAERVRELWQQRLLGGYERDPAQALGEGFVDARRDMVIIRGIAVHGVCPHHLVPFRGVAHVAYLPGGRLHGFGRIARMVGSSVANSRSSAITSAPVSRLNRVDLPALV